MLFVRMDVVCSCWSVHINYERFLPNKLGHWLLFHVIGMKIRNYLVSDPSCWLSLLVVATVSVQQAAALCPSHQFWTPNDCRPLNDAANTWCRDCPTNSVQYVSPTGDQKDEACMCKQGYYASDMSLRCTGINSYNSLVPGWENPPVEDSFTCVSCDAAAGEICRGGVTDYDCFTSVYYKKCETCVSGYDFSEESSCDTRAVKHTLPHYCLIFGQSAVTDSSGKLVCKCPKDSFVSYDNGIVGWNLCQDQKNCKGIWYKDISPLFVPPGENKRKVSSSGKWDSNGWPMKYFGSCECPPGFYRDSARSTNAFYYEECKVCPDNSFCYQGVRETCGAGWKAAATGASAPLQCK